ncbi:hypothetical protein Mgra_00009728 [Meloidogyne graminicola]|uniref:Uncharacterized protein n=1 Tax=Meloidogyne graminicola TaxID=189291 RepID=A0A8S9ZB88_9BILA|nr:hypothetical protein Mgra_00009728 [Meloidogyne graminicola]
MNTNRSESSSTSSCVFSGKLVHDGAFNLKLEHKLLPNEKNKQNTLKLFGNTTTFKNTSVTIQVGQQTCQASFNDKTVLCNLPVDKPQNGNLIFSFKGKEVKIPFKNVQLFNANLCEIELENYDKEKHIVQLKINGLTFKIIESKDETKECKPTQ